MRFFNAEVAKGAEGRKGCHSGRSLPSNALVGGPGIQSVLPTKSAKTLTQRFAEAALTTGSAFLCETLRWSLVISSAALPPSLFELPPSHKASVDRMADRLRYGFYYFSFECYWIPDNHAMGVLTGMTIVYPFNFSQCSHPPQW
jgi:hypothetical protein